VNDTDLYRHLLGLESPWTVAKVNLSVETQRVEVFVEHPKGQKWPCPACGELLPVYDHSEERVWRHLDSCQFQTFLHAKPPRVKCPKDGVRQVLLPWAEPKARFTLLFERLAIDVMRVTHIKAAQQILRISWDEAWHILYRAVQRGLIRKKPRLIQHLGVDEKSIARGQKYFTLVCDLDLGTVEHIGDGRNRRSFESYLETLTDEQLEAIVAIAMDMHEAYVQAALAKIPDAERKIVFDLYHIMQHMGGAVDEVRRKEHKALAAEGDDRLARTRYMWLYGKEKVPRKYWTSFYLLRKSDLLTARAWALKESLRRLWRYKRLSAAKSHWKSWYFWATHCRLEPVKKVAKMLKTRLTQVFNYFTHRITNALSEGINSKVEAIKNTARGFRNPERFKIMIWFRLGGLDLYPSTHGNPG
jgi:transposase